MAGKKTVILRLVRLLTKPCRAAADAESKSAGDPGSGVPVGTPRPNRTNRFAKDLEAEENQVGSAGQPDGAEDRLGRGQQR